jgi:5-methyltetrahydrofolate--homocysteine methyltransferase
MPHLLDILADRVLLCDGGMGTSVMPLNLDAEKDFGGFENCTDILTRYRPDVIRGIHMGFLEAGSDMIQTNTFGANPVTLGEFGLAEETFSLNKEAGELAREAVEAFRGDGRARFVLGDIGPGSKLPSLGHIDYDTMEQGYVLQCAGHMASGVDAILIITCQDPLQVKAAVNGAKRALAEAGKDLPILLQVTVETNGTMLVGSDIAAMATTAAALDVPMMGLNCATGPQEMAPHVEWLGQNWPGLIGVQPNAGLPQLVEGRTHYPLEAAELATWMERFIERDGVTFVGGCCGTGDGHLAALDAMLRRRAPRGSHRPAAVRRRIYPVAALASLYSRLPLGRDDGVLAIGGQCNAARSEAFRASQEAADWDSCVALARRQERAGSQALEVGTAFAGADEAGAMAALVDHLRTAVAAPLVVASEDAEVLETALKLYGGKAVIKAIDLAGGQETAAERLRLARRFGSAVIARTSDQQGPAPSAGDRLGLARELHDLACGVHGLAAADLLIDPVAAPVSDGDCPETLAAVAAIRGELPDCQVVLEIGAVSAGLEAAARQVLESVFLHEAAERGLSAAIVDSAGTLPVLQLEADDARAARELIFAAAPDVAAFAARFAGRAVGGGDSAEPPAEVAERLKRRIIEGDRPGLDDDLAEALEDRTPLDIINNVLLDGMKSVGNLYGEGKLPLPYVLQSAETMKAAVNCLEPFMDRASNVGKGCIVLATVKGDVHDIGKNLVDVLLSNNGYRVVNLGSKQTIDAIIQAADEHGADAIGMSGLLLASALVMRENLKEMTRQAMDLPVLVGGAALNRRFVDEDCAEAYECRRVVYARDVFDGLRFMDMVVEDEFDDHLTEVREAQPERPSRPAPAKQARPVDLEEIRLRRAELQAQVKVPEPPFLGSRVIEEIAPRTLVPLLDEAVLFRFHWGFKSSDRSAEQWREWAFKEARPILQHLLKTCEHEAILQPKAAYGFWRCAAEGDDLVLFGEDAETEATRFAFPRQARADGLCISDFFRTADSGQRDIIALQAVTMGQRVGQVMQQWFEADRYQNYLYLNGLAAEMTEALAEYVHQLIRTELGIADADAAETEELLRQGYRGARYSFGFPACPDLADQRRLLDLLGGERLGIVIGEEGQMHPEQSTSAFVVHHPQARYFSL